MSIQEKEFLEQKGDPNWLLGLNHIPTKLRNLLTLNKLLAHQPHKVQADVYKVCVMWLWSITSIVFVMKVAFHPLLISALNKIIYYDFSTSDP